MKGDGGTSKNPSTPSNVCADAGSVTSVSSSTNWLNIGLSAATGIGCYLITSWLSNKLTTYTKTYESSWPFGYLINTKKSSSSSSSSSSPYIPRNNNKSEQKSETVSNNLFTNNPNIVHQSDQPHQPDQPSVNTPNQHLSTQQTQVNSNSRSTNYSTDTYKNDKHDNTQHNQYSQEASDDERPDIPENAPDSCPGVYSENAGFSEGCDGCPNQRLCASGDAIKPDPTLAEGLKKLDEIKHKILVLSGKGGVGKSTISAQLSWALQRRGFEVGLLDIDICGPSIPRMTGAIGRDVHLSMDGWSPIYVEDNLAVMSIGFLLPEDDDAVIWRGPKKNALIRQFLTDVTWGEMDFLIIDTPPGTSDEHLSIVTFLKESGIDGAVVVTTPQEMALQDVRKEINFCKKGNIPVLGVIENMSNSIFSANTGGAKKMSQNMNVPYLGSLPMDTTILKATETGVSAESFPTISPGTHELGKILNTLLSILNEPLFSNNYKTTFENTS